MNRDPSYLRHLGELATVEVKFTLEEMAGRDLERWKSAGKKPSAKEIQEWVEFMRLFLQDLELGKRYVYPITLGREVLGNVPSTVRSDERSAARAAEGNL